MKIYCLTVDNNHYKKIKDLGYIPVGLGKNISNVNFIRDNTKENISEKNPFYGEYTFHYWLWKNYDTKLEKEWIGFCQYRKFWGFKKSKINISGLSDLKDNILGEIPEKYDNYESIIGEPFFVNQFRLSKFIKHNLKTMISKPSILFNKKKRNLKFHFDMMHGKGNLEKAIKLLDKKDQNEFMNFVNTEVSFNPHNMMICKSFEILNEYYNNIFPWLKKCENEFGFNLEGYGLKRIYGFLAERYLSYWFQRYTKFKTLPIIFQDISNLN